MYTHVRNRAFAAAIQTTGDECQAQQPCRSLSVRLGVPDVVILRRLDIFRADLPQRPIADRGVEVVLQGIHEARSLS